ncbi:MAG: transpeptidase family protein, partial [Bryobacterales bacterium]|nr:transpeptidase family protein [Bryobacterales bacterium]
EARMNRAVSLEYEPGSVFKIITLAAGLERTRLRPDTIIPCGSGMLRLPGRTIRDAHPYSALSFADVLAKSSNIGAIYVAMAVGKELMYDYMRAFGFGTKTGLPLPYEQSGYVWPMHQASSQKVYGSILASVAMGHQVSATTVQLAQACSVIANGGTLVRPRLLMELRAPDGKVTPLDGKRENRVLRPETAITMRKLMEGVMLTGTGKGARLKGWTSGGKTGTAQIFDLKQRRYVSTYNSSFLGFAPLQNPSIVVVVTLNETKLYGGAIAAPVFQEVAAETLRILGVPMDSPQTVLASNSAPKPEDVKEGDAGLEGETSARMDTKLPPDTRKDLLAMLSAAMKEDPEIEEWMLGNPRDRVATALPAIAPISVRPASSTEEPLDAGLPDVESSGGGEIAAETERAQREFEDSGKLVPVSVSDSRAGAVTVVHVDTMLAPDFTGKSMREVMAEAMNEGVELHVFGRGIARKQIPPAGTRMPRGVAIRVMFTP